MLLEGAGGLDDRAEVAMRKEATAPTTMHQHDLVPRRVHIDSKQRSVGGATIGYDMRAAVASEGKLYPV